MHRMHRLHRRFEIVRCCVAGMEATQAIQVSPLKRTETLGGPITRTPIPLIDGKPLAVRLYPDVHLDQADARLWVGGELWIRQHDAIDWQPADSLPGHLCAPAVEHLDRGNPRHSLNYRIPVKFCTGQLQLRGRIRCRAASHTLAQSDWEQTTLTFERVSPLRLKVFGVCAAHDGQVFPAPSVEEVLETLDFASKTFPIPRAEIVSFQKLNFLQELDVSSERTARRWLQQLLVTLARLRTAGLNNWIHLGVLPRQAPRYFLGLGGAGLAVCYSGDGATAAQELGHALGRAHAPGGNPADIDPQFPVYDNLPPGSIGEFGFDPITGRVYAPHTCRDFMSYGGTQWVSPYSYLGLLEFFRREAALPSRESEEYLHLEFSLDKDHGCELHSGIVLSGPQIGSYENEVRCRVSLQDQTGSSLSNMLVSGETTLGGKSRFACSVPYHPAVRQIVIECCKQHPPHLFKWMVNGLSIQLLNSFDEGKLYGGPCELRWWIAWKKPPEYLVVLVRYTADGGSSWLPLHTGFEPDGCRLNFDELPGGDDCRLQLIASAITESACVESNSFRVAHKTPSTIGRRGNLQSG